MDSSKLSYRGCQNSGQKYIRKIAKNNLNATGNNDNDYYYYC